MMTSMRSFFLFLYSILMIGVLSLLFFLCCYGTLSVMQFSKEVNKRPVAYVFFEAKDEEIAQKNYNILTQYDVSLDTKLLTPKETLEAIKPLLNKDYFGSLKDLESVASYVVLIYGQKTRMNHIENVLSLMKKELFVDQVFLPDASTKNLQTFSVFMQVISWLLGFFLLFLLLFGVAQAIYALIDRRLEEIRVFKWLGASFLSLCMPLVWRGALLAFLGVLLGLLCFLGLNHQILFPLAREAGMLEWLQWPYENPLFFVLALSALAASFIMGALVAFIMSRYQIEHRT